MKKALILGTAALAFVAAPVALSQVVIDRDTISAAPIYQPVQLRNDGAMSYDAQRGVLTMAPLLERVTPAVVSINTTVERRRPAVRSDEEEMFERFFGRTPQRRGPSGGLGSGVIVDARDGLILTNNHVIDNADEIEVMLEDGREFVAKVVGADPKTDLALLEIEASNLKALPIAKSDDVRVGDYVIAVGNPFGLSSTVTSGIVSALGRDNRSSADSYSDFIQTDASINPGNSGGALVNSKGELIGINTAIVSRSGGNNGIGFAVPTRIIRSVMTQLQEFGEVKRGRIGVLIGDLTPELREGLGLGNVRGALISEVVDDSPAERAGLQSGDVVVAFSGETVEDASDLRNAVGLLSPGARADITYLRDDRRRTTRITVEAVEEERTVLDDSAADDIPSMESFSGATITDIPEDLDLRGGDEGVYVSEVRPGSRAARSGLRRGDIIRQVNREDVDDLKDFEAVLESKSGPYALVVERDGRTAYLGVR